MTGPLSCCTPIRHIRMRSAAQIILRSLGQRCTSHAEGNPSSCMGLLSQCLPALHRPAPAVSQQSWTHRAASTSACCHGQGLQGPPASGGILLLGWAQQQRAQLLQPWPEQWCVSNVIQRRTLFGTPKQAVNLQIHTHSKYKVSSPQPHYNWMLGRFVIDRNGVVWHKQANRGSKRHLKSSSTLGRLARWKALHPTIAAKFRKLPGVKESLRYWAPPDPRAVPGFEGDQPYQAPARRNAKVKDDVALRPHGKLKHVRMGK